MVKIKDFRIETLEEVLEKQNELLEENEQYTFRIKEIFLNGYCLEVYIPKKDKLHILLDGYYEAFRKEVDRLENINKEQK